MLDLETPQKSPTEQGLVGAVLIEPIIHITHYYTLKRESLKEKKLFQATRKMIGVHFNIFFFQIFHIHTIALIIVILKLQKNLSLIYSFFFFTFTILF